jgi:hypothetical protein
MKRERIAHRADVSIEAQRSFERATRSIDAPEAQLEDACTLHMNPRGEVWLRRVRIGHPTEVRDQVFPTIFVGGRNAFALVGAFLDEHAARKIGFEAFERRRMMRRTSEHELPRFARIVLSIAGDEQTRTFDEQLDGRCFTRRDRDLALEMTEHRHELRSMMETPSKDRMRWRKIRIDLERGFDLGVHARVVGERLVDDRKLDMYTREAHAIFRIGQTLDTRSEQVCERIAFDRDARRLGCS